MAAESLVSGSLLPDALLVVDKGLVDGEADLKGPVGDELLLHRLDLVSKDRSDAVGRAKLVGRARRVGLVARVGRLEGRLARLLRRRTRRLGVGVALVRDKAVLVDPRLCRHSIATLAPSIRAATEERKVSWGDKQ